MRENLKKRKALAKAKAKSDVADAEEVLSAIDREKSNPEQNGKDA